MALVLSIGLLAGCGSSTPNASDGETVNSSTADNNASTGNNSSTGNNGSAGDNSSADNNGSTGDLFAPLTGTVTLKQYLDNGPKVGFYGDFPLDKDKKPTEMYLFENGKVYFVYSFDKYDAVTQEYALTWGEIAQMSDEELLAHARKYMSLHAGAVKYENGVYYYEFDPNTANVHVNHIGPTDYDVYPTDLGNYIKKPGDYIFSVRESDFQHGYLDATREYGNYEFREWTAWMALYYYDPNQPNSKYGAYIGHDVIHFDPSGNLYISDGEDMSYTLMPYDGRYGELKLPEMTFKWDYAKIMTTGAYTLHVDTDSTGNRTETEQISVELTTNHVKYEDAYTKTHESITKQTGIIELYNTSSAQGTVYGSTFTVLFNSAKQERGLIFRTGADLTITLDKPGDTGVAVD